MDALYEKKKNLKKECSKATGNFTLSLPADLTEIVPVWPVFPLFLSLQIRAKEQRLASRSPTYVVVAIRAQIHTPTSPFTHADAFAPAKTRPDE